MVLVALNHAGIGFLGGGYIGVDVFFVVSGFLITGLLLRDQAEFGRIRFLNFYARRARRILPMAALALIATDVAALVLLNYVRARIAVEDSIWAAFFAANIQFERIGADYFASAQPPSPIQHFWSLAVEEQFYLVWPALLALLLAAGLIISARRDRGKASNWPVAVALTVIIGASVAWSIAQTRNVPSDAYFSALTRAWELGAGAALAGSAGLVARIPGVVKAAISWLGLAGILASAVWFTAATPFPGVAALLPVGATVLTVAGGTGASRFGADVLLGLRPFRFVGDVSYSFYLWHWPFLVIAGGMTLAPLGLTSKLGLVVAAFVTSVLTYLLYENPIRRARFLFGRRGRGALALWPVSIAFVGLVGFLALNSLNAAQLARDYTGIPSPVASPSPLLPGTSFDSATAAVAAAVAAANANAPIPLPLSPPVDKLASDVYPLPFGCEAGPTENRGKICPLGDVHSSRTVVVFGDSHAMMWLSPLVAIAQNRGWKLIPFTKSSCHDAAWITGDTTCSEWYKWAVGQIKSIRPNVVVLGHCSSDCGVSDWSGLRAAIRSLKLATPRLVVMGDPPGFDIQPADCLLSPGATMRTCTFEIPAAKSVIIDQAFSTVQAEGAEYLDVLPWFCSQGECPMVIGKTIAWSDKGHISRTYGLKLVAGLDGLLKLGA